jgi:putative transposase
LKRREGRLGDHWHLDEVFIRINRQQRYLWRAVDQDGDVIDVLSNRIVISAPQSDFFENSCVARVPNHADHYRQIEQLLRCHAKHLQQRDSQGGERYANNRVEASHQPTRQRERQMRRFKSARHAQRFLSLHDAVRNLFRVGRHLLRSSNHRLLRSRSFAVWQEVTAA